MHVYPPRSGMWKLSALWFWRSDVNHYVWYIASHLAPYWITQGPLMTDYDFRQGSAILVCRTPQNRHSYYPLKENTHPKFDICIIYYIFLCHSTFNDVVWASVIGWHLIDQIPPFCFSRRIFALCYRISYSYLTSVNTAWLKSIFCFVISWISIYDR